MLKFLLLILLVALIWWLWPRRSPGSDRTEGRKATPTRPRGTPAQPPLREPDIIVECAQCGLHLPQAEAVAALSDQQKPDSPPTYFCSQAHRDAALRSRE